jgi:endogenous inhibitor of DNA gyrase (YacG/DUF329 family)
MSRHCPVCQKPFEPKESPALPFCSERCRLIDLGRWLNEGYGMPIEREDAGEEPPGDAEEP